MPGDTLTRSLTLLLELEETSLLDFFVVRQALEIVAAPRAAQYATQEQISSLRNCLAEMAATINQGIHVEEHFKQFTQHDIELHSLVAQSSQNLPLSTLLNVILPLIMSGRLEIINRNGGFKKFIARSRPETILEEHTNIVNAIVNRDPTAAEHFVYKHLQRSMAAYRDLTT
jgi:DNA-binding FadR family transcriptional regulator